jgi:hypothetical protein
VCAVNDPAKRNPSKVSSNWLSIVEDVFPRWRDRLGSKKAASELEALLRYPETRSRYVSASGEETLLDGEFWRDMARLEVVPDDDGVVDRLEVHRPKYVHGPAPFLPGGTFSVRRTDVERHERLYFPMTPASPPAHGHSAEAEPLRKRGRKERIQWGLIKIEMMRLMDHHDEFSFDDPEWNAQARLEEALKQYCQRRFSEEPSDGALRQKLPDWLAEWRSRKSQGISTSS